MAGNPSNPLLYLGTTAFARPGDPVPLGAQMRTDRGAALADAWAEAQETCHIPHVYQVSDGIIRAAVLPSGALAWTALSGGRGNTAAPAPKEVQS